MFAPVLLALAAAPGAPPSAPADPAAFFETNVRPALVAHCGKCHTGESAKAGFRVDSRAALLAGGDSGAGAVPGDAKQGTFLDAVRYDNADRAMPPKGKLPDAVIRDLETWVRAGAVWPDAGAADSGPAGKPAFDLAGRKAAHWAWKPVTPHAPPAVNNAGWVRDPADAFILAKLEAAGLSPAPRAEPLVLLRRVTFALTGLPPTPAEIDAFVGDSAARNPRAAFEAVVDRLLASPAYGERWGRHWLDVVRYAESRGHEFDPDIPNAFMFRDYVVRALNADVPYDRFAREHLAGDVLADPRLDPKTGANEAVVGTGFWHLGEEVHSPVDVRQDQADRMDNRLDVFSKAFLGLTVACARCHDHKFDAISAADYAALFGVVQPGGYRQVRVDGWRENRAAAAELARLQAVATAGLSRTVPADAALETWLKSAQVLDVGNPDDVALVRRAAGSVSVRPDGTARVEPRAAWVLDRFWDDLAPAAGTQPDAKELAKRVVATAGFTVRTPTAPAAKRTLYALVRGGGTLYAGVCGHAVIGGPLHRSLVAEFRDSKTYRWVSVDLKAYRGQPVYAELSAAPGTDFAVAAVALADSPPPTPAPDNTPGVELPTSKLQHYVSPVETLRRSVVWKSRLAPAMSDAAGTDEAVFVRGSPKARGEVVPRRSLEALAGRDALLVAAGSGRAELAMQLTDPGRNPLFARVHVNRVWHHLFGRGLVATVDNFGALGEKPTHPELLDALAADFARDGFSQKKLIRRLVLSAAYAQASDAPTAAADPGNELLQHFRLKRLEGEAVRDAILQASGRLDRTVGGPPVPVHLTAFLTGRGRPADGPLDGAGRRSLYLSVRRNFLSPFLLAFDTPIPFSTVGRRQVSNVPAQSLILMNDPFVHAEAKRWGDKLAAAPGTPAERVAVVFRTALGRPPTDAEVRACTASLADTPAGWADLAHAAFNVKEFVFVR